MRSLTIAAASINPSNSPVMLITRPCGDCAAHWPSLCIFKDGCIVLCSDSFEIENSVEFTWWGARLSPRKQGGISRALLRTRFSKVMKLEDVIDRDSRMTSSGAVFVGTSVPVKLLFEFLEDDQTVDTFLDQFPMVSRDQARAVLGASRDMLLSAPRSEI